MPPSIGKSGIKLKIPHNKFMNKKKLKKISASASAAIGIPDFKTKKLIPAITKFINGPAKVIRISFQCVTGREFWGMQTPPNP